MTDARQPPWDGPDIAPLPEGVFRPHERWAYARIARGMIADMARYVPDADPQSRGWVHGDKDGYGRDAADVADWPEHRVLSAKFLRLVLFHPPYSTVSERPGVRIAHARFTGQIDFSARTTVGELWFNDCRFEEDVVWQSLTVNGVLSLEGCWFAKRIMAHRLTVKGGVFLRRVKRVGEVVLRGAVIGRDLHLSRTNVEGEIDLTGAEIGGELHLSRGRDERPHWGEGARLSLRNVKAGALVGGLAAFRRHSADPRRPGPFVPVSLSGFDYKRLGGYGSDGGETLAQAPWRDLAQWLKAGRDERLFTPEPYRELAAALDAAGYAYKAARIRHVMRRYEAACERNPGRRIALALSGMFIGHGFRSDYAVRWFLALVLAFAALGLWATGDLATAGPAEIARWLWFSLGNAIPLISLDKAHETFLADRFGVDPAATPVGVASAFYVEKLLGFVILTYLAAALSGQASKDRG